MPWATTVHRTERIYTGHSQRAHQESADATGARTVNVTPTAPLSEREKLILKLAAEGMSRKEIAWAIKRSPKTIDYFFTGNGNDAGIFTKLGTNSIALATQWALANGIAEWKV